MATSGHLFVLLLVLSSQMPSVASAACMGANSECPSGWDDASALLQGRTFVTLESSDASMPRGCYWRSPSGCPVAGLAANVWRRDAWGETRANAGNENGCEQRRMPFNWWCGVDDVQMFFNEAPSDATKWPSPSPPGCYWRSPSGCPVAGLAANVWRRDAWGETHANAGNENGCKQRRMPFNGLCRVDDVQMFFNDAPSDATKWPSLSPPGCYWRSPSGCPVAGLAANVWRRDAWGETHSNAGNENGCEQRRMPVNWWCGVGDVQMFFNEAPSDATKWPGPELAPDFDCTKSDANCAQRLGATHWDPCYYINASVPSLIDGAQSLQSMGSRVIKVTLSAPQKNYPWNSPDWPDRFDTMVSTARHSYYRALWNMDFDTFVLVSGSSIPGGYWRWGISPDQEAQEAEEFYEVASFFLSEYPAKTFVFENWEGDWASRTGQGANEAATDLSLNSMTKWLAARQAGVTRARSQHRKPHAQGNVYHAAEVNLVHSSRTTGFPNMINKVVPNVALDMVSYSAYETQASPVHFKAAMQYIIQQHNRTPASPPGARSFFVAEYGVPMMSPGASTHTPSVVKNVVNSALNFGAAYVLWWATYDNECVDGKGCINKRCRDIDNPVTDPQRLRGWWLVKPDGSYAWPHQYLASKIQAADAASQGS